MNSLVISTDDGPLDLLTGILVPGGYRQRLFPIYPRLTALIAASDAGPAAGRSERLGGYYWLVLTDPSAGTYSVVLGLRPSSKTVDPLHGRLFPRTGHPTLLIL